MPVNDDSLMARRLFMKLFSRGKLREVLDPGLALALLLALFCLVPLVMNPGLPAGSDGLYHRFRLADRWLGAGLEQATPGLADYLARLFRFALGVGALEALRLLILVSLLSCSGGMYLFCRRRSGSLGALLAGLLYAYSPYLMFTQAYARGAYPELLALALFPLLLWRIDALRDKPSAPNFAALFLLQVLLLGAHDMTALLLSAIAIAWVAFETAIQRFNREASQLQPEPGWLALGALLLGIIGAAALWLPMLLANRSPPASLSHADLLEASRAFTRLRDLLAPAPIHDASAINGLRELRIMGSAQWIAALTGALGAAALYISGYRTRHPQAFLGTVYFVALVAVLLWLMTPASVTIWEGLRLPLLPWQLLGGLAACLAISASMNGIWLESLAPRYQMGWIALAIALPIVTAIPLLYVPEWRQADLESAINAYHEAEPAAPQAPAPVAEQAAPPDAHSPWTDVFPPIAAAFSIALLGFALWFLHTREPPAFPYWASPPLSRRGLSGILLGGGIALLSFAITFRDGVAWLRSPPGEALPAQVRRQFTLEDSLQLLGYDLDGQRWHAGETVLVNAYWYAPEATDKAFASFLVLSSNGEQVAQSQRQQPGGRAVSEWWSASAYMIDSHQLLLPSDLPPGDYDLAIGLAVCAGQPPATACQAGYEGGESGSLNIALESIRLEAR